MTQSPPLAGIRVLEFAGLGPGPFIGMLLADFGATVLRIDRAHCSAYTDNPPPPTSDGLTRRKSSITVDTKTSEGIELIKKMIPRVDVVIDPFRPGVLERMGLRPGEDLLALNPRLIVARMTGFRRDGKYKDMAGHDINYIAVSGVLSMLGRRGQNPHAPGNIVGDYAGGGAVCFMGILMALLHRERHGRGQVVEANMVDGSAYIATMPRLCRQTSMWDGPRGTNLLDGGCPYYDTYETKDGGFMAVGALEPQFYQELLKGLEIDASQIGGRRDNKKTWSHQRRLFEEKFISRTRSEWEHIFDQTDACCTPVLTQDELETSGFDHRPIVTLAESPAYKITRRPFATASRRQGQGQGVKGDGWKSDGLPPGEGGEAVLQAWMGWRRERDYRILNGALVSNSSPKL